MKKGIIAILIVLVSLSLFAETLGTQVDKLTKIAEKCFEENIYTKELYNLETKQVWGGAVYIPFIDQLSNDAPEFIKGTIGGALVIKITVPISPMVSVSKITIKITGRSQYSDEIIDTYPYIVFLDNHWVIELDTEAEIATDKEYIVFLVASQKIKANTDYLVTLTTRTSAVSWTIKMNDEQMEKLQQIISELGL